MGLSFQDFEDIYKKMLDHPIKTALFILGLITLTIIAYYAQGYFSEKGKQSASNTYSSSLATNSKPKLVTISSNEIALSGPGHYLVDTENKAKSGYLTRISGLSEGDKAILKAASNDRTVVIREGRYLIMAAPIFYLNNKNDKIVFISDKDGICIEDSRISIGD